jgi:hypothetical protein
MSADPAKNAAFNGRGSIAILRGPGGQRQRPVQTITMSFALDAYNRRSAG